MTDRLTNDERRMILRSIGLLLVSPATLAYAASLLLHSSTQTSLTLQILIGLVFMKFVHDRPVMQATAATVFLLEFCTLVKFPTMWGVCISLLSFITTMVLRPDNEATGWEGLRNALHPYEINVARMLFALIVTRTSDALQAVYGGTAPVPRAVHDYSVGQCLCVVEVCLSGLVLTLLMSEVVAYCAHLLSAARARLRNSVLDAGQIGKAAIARTPTPCGPCTFATTLLVSAAVVARVLVFPQLAYHGVASPLLWVLGFVFRAPGYYELLLCVYWVVLIVGAVVFGYYAAVRYHWPRTCNRKIFHALVVALFVPAMSGSGALLVSHSEDCTGTFQEGHQYRLFSFLVLGLGVAVGLFLLSEYARLRFSVPAPARCRTRGREADLSGNVGSADGNALLGGAVRAVSAYMELFLSAEAKVSAVVGGTTATHVGEDARHDRPQLEISHITLLLGCAGPVWLFAFLCAQRLRFGHCGNGIIEIIEGMLVGKLAICEASGEAGEGAITTLRIGSTLLLSMLPYVGILTLGIGDAAAAVVGKLYGRLRWSAVLRALGARGMEDNTRTIEGSVACFVSMSAASWWVLHSQYDSIAAQASAVGWQIADSDDVFVAAVCVVQLSLLLVTLVEAFTTANDNIVLPILLSLLLMLSARFCFNERCS